MIDSMDHPFQAQKTLAICSLGELGVFSLAFFVPQIINNLPFKTQCFIAMIIFALGFFAGYGLMKLYDFFYTNRGPETRRIDSGIMSGYQYVEQQSQRWTSGVLASAA